MKYAFLLVAIRLLFSCKDRDPKIELARMVTEWQGKELVFPANPIFTRYVTDTVDYRIQNSEYKVLVYVDSTGCTSCKRVSN
ncbi:hypothetical protein FACS1894199_06030 [Bacteroidia bacterium]|nr:hypothetical protein FACS1894199_06030 [Bacteroidia bacterium]